MSADIFMIEDERNIAKEQCKQHKMSAGNLNLVNDARDIIYGAVKEILKMQGVECLGS